METLILCSFSFLFGLAVMAWADRGIKKSVERVNKEIERTDKLFETFPQYLERVGAIKPKKSYIEQEVERYNKQLRDAMEVEPFPTGRWHESYKPDYTVSLADLEAEANRQENIFDEVEKLISENPDLLAKFEKEIHAACEVADEEIRAQQYEDIAFWTSKVESKVCSEDMQKSRDISNKCQDLVYKSQSKQLGIWTIIKSKIHEDHKVFPLDKNGNYGC